MGGDKGSVSRLSVRISMCMGVCVCVWGRVCFKCRNRSLTNESAEGYASVSVV